MADFSLEDKIAQYGGNPARMLRQDKYGMYKFQWDEQFTNWRDEETAWHQTAVLFDQSYHMSDVYFTGPDVKRLFSENVVNNFGKFGRNRAKQIITVNADGNFIGDAICFGFEDDQYVVVGSPTASDWLTFRARTGGYDVAVEADPASQFNPNPRRKFRYQLQGPLSLDIIRKVAGDAPEKIKFFQMGEFDIAGVHVRALNHTMVGVPGNEGTGLEMTGPREQSGPVLEALAKAGEEFGLRMGGSWAYQASDHASGWFAMPVSAIYSGEAMKSYREYLPGDRSFQAHASIGGSLESDDIRDYYVTPWDLGYGRVINYEHDFYGREALLARKDEPHKTKVWLRWNDADAVDVIASSLYDAPNGAKFMEMPSAAWVTSHYDQVLAGGARVGIANWAVYITNFAAWVQLGLIDSQYAKDGTELELLWGNESAIGVNPLVEAHKTRSVRVTVHTTPPFKTR